MTDSQNRRDQTTSDHIAFCAFHSFLSGGDNDRRSKRFCSSVVVVAMLCIRFMRQIVKTGVIRLRVIILRPVRSIHS